VQSVILNVATICGALTAISIFAAKVMGIIKKSLEPIQSLKAQDCKITDALLSVLRFNINRAYRDYKEAGKISRIGLQLLAEMGEKYENLGGNGYIKGILADVKTIPLEM